MNIYSFELIDERSCLLLKNDSDIEILSQKTGHGKYDNLNKDFIPLVASKKFDHNSELYDLPWLYSDGLLCRQRAYKLFQEFLRPCGSWSKMRYKDETLYYFSTTVVLDALDKELTQFRVYDGFVVDVDVFAFKNIDYSMYPIFRIKGIEAYYPVVTDDFLNFCKKHSLKGLKFKKLNAN